MILKAIRVEGWRCFASPVELRGFSERINVVHALNATGKSTLFEALTRAFFDSHKVSGEEIGRIQPWGRSLSPTVAVDFEHGGTTYRLVKRFLSGRMSRLSRLEGERFEPLHENERADEFVRKMLMGHAPGRGISRQQHWGLGQILWAPQGQLAIHELSEDLVRAIQQVASAQLLSAQGTAVEQRIRDAYLDVFQPKKGGPKKGTKLAELPREVKEVEERIAELRHMLENFDEASRRVEDLRKSQATARRQLQKLQETAQDARSRADEYAKLNTELEKCRREESESEAKYQKLNQRIEEILKTRKKLAEQQRARKETQQRLPALRKSRDDRAKRRDQASAQLSGLRKDRQEITERREAAEDARRLAEQRLLKAQLEERVARVESIQAQKDELQEKRNGLVAPDTLTLRKINNAARELDQAAAQLDAALITLEIVPEKPATLNVVVGDEPGVRKLAKGRAVQLRGSPSVAVEWKGVGRVAASGPAESVEELRARLDKARRKFARLTTPYGTKDVSELEKLRDKAAKLDSEIEQLAGRLEEALGDETLDDLKEKLALCNATIRNIVAAHPDWEQEPPDADELLKNLNADERKVNDKIRKAEHAWQEAVAAAQSAQTELKTCESDLKRIEKDNRGLQDRLAELTSDGLSDQDREQQRDKLAMKWNADRLARESVEQKLSEFPIDPTEEVERLEKQLEKAREESIRRGEEEQKAIGRLEALAGEGPYSALAEKEEKLESLKKDLRREELRASAIRLLHETVLNCKKRTLDAIKEPVQEHAARLIRRIAGPRMGHVELADALGPRAVRPSTAEKPVGIDDLSGGEKEQLYLAVRLALAEIFCREERQLVAGFKRSSTKWRTKRSSSS